MRRQRFHITIMPRREVVQRFLRQHEAEVYAETFNRVMRNTDIRAEVGVEPDVLKSEEPAAK